MLDANARAAALSAKSQSKVADLCRLHPPEEDAARTPKAVKGKRVSESQRADDALRAASLAEDFAKVTREEDGRVRPAKRRRPRVTQNDVAAMDSLPRPKPAAVEAPPPPPEAIQTAPAPAPVPAAANAATARAASTPKQPQAKAGLPSWLTEHLRACGAHACLAPPAPPADPLDNLVPFPVRSARASPPSSPWDELLEAGGAR